MNLDDHLKNVESQEDFFRLQKEYYYELSRGIKELKKNKRRLRTKIIAGKAYRGYSFFYDFLKTNFKRKVAYSVVCLGLLAYLSSPTYNSKQDIINLTSGKHNVSSTNENDLNSRKPKTEVSTSDSVGTGKASPYGTDKASADPVGNDSSTHANDLSYIYFPVRGDTLIKIARSVTGNGNNWHQILDYNNLSYSDVREIEVNQPIFIPSSLVKNKDKLFYGSFEEDIEEFDGVHILNSYFEAGRNSSFSSIANKVYGSTNFGEKIYSYNKKINPRFSRKIYEREYIFLPPKSYLKK